MTSTEDSVPEFVVDKVGEIVLEVSSQRQHIALNPIDMYNFFNDVIHKNKSVDTVVPVLLETLNNSGADIDSFMDVATDALHQCNIETQCSDNKEERDLFVTIGRTILSSKIVSESIMKERFDIETNAAIGLIVDKKQTQTTYNRLRTKLYFKQSKYNLMKEENEGFAKIISQLTLASVPPYQEVLDNLIQTIGRYKVDPNRVLDLILETFEFDPHNADLYVKLLKDLHDCPDKIRQIIVLKLGFYTHPKAELNVVPQSMYRLIAMLIQRDIIELNDLYPYLLPEDSKVLDYHKKLVEEAKVESKRYGLAIVGGGEEKHRDTVYEKLTEEERHILEVDNQKINICAHLVRIGDWENASILAKKLPEFYCFSNKRVALGACDLLSYLIDKIYKEFGGLPPIIKQKLSSLPCRNYGPEQITTVSQLQAQLFPLLFAVGPFVSADTLLLTKLIRLLKGVLCQRDANNQNLISQETQLYYDILEVINDCILPGVTLSDSNCCLARELWSLMKNLSYHTRYKLYFNWKDEGINHHLLRKKGDILLKAKHHMKRLSKDTIRSTGRHLGKLCYSTPVVTLGYILLQIQSYDNLIVPLVDALKYLPSLALDVMICCVIETLADPLKKRQSNDGMAIAPWLTSISTFSANFILKYKVEFSGFLQFIANQLKTGKSLDLILLADLIQKMTGIEANQDITDDKIDALLGGEVLRAEGAYFNQGKNTRKSAARLKDALIESKLAMPLCILMAQLRDCLFFSQQDETHLKLVGKLYDQCQETFVQYGVFLSLNLSDDYINFLPPLETLMNEHRLSPDAAFFLARPMILHKIKAKFNELQALNAKKSPAEVGEKVAQNESELYIKAANSIIDPLVEALQPTIETKYGQFSAKWFVLFWTLSMSDLEVPSGCYEREVYKLKQNYSDNDDDPKRRKENEKIINLIHKLKNEESEQVDHCKNMNSYLEFEKNKIFVCNSELTHQFIQHCLFSRSILTAYDAIYSARFILALHELKIDGFSTLICYDRLLCDITYMMGACTEKEANNYGRFLSNILKTITYWHSDSQVYDQRCSCYPGFVLRGTDEKEPKTNLDYENFRHVCHKWHYRLTKALIMSLESNSYVQIRNALIVLISIIDYYPVISNFGKAIEKRVEEVRTEEKDSRHDLYALATAYFGRLEGKKSTFIPDSKFHKPEKPLRSCDESTTAKKQQSDNGASKTDSNSPNSPNNQHSSSSNHHSNLNLKTASNSSISHRRRESPTDSQRRINEHYPPSSDNHKKRPSDGRSSSSSRPSSKTRRTNSPVQSRERHSSSASRKRLKKD